MESKETAVRKRSREEREKDMGFHLIAILLYCMVMLKDVETWEKSKKIFPKRFTLFKKNDMIK